jgi:hypothetical protein
MSTRTIRITWEKAIQDAVPNSYIDTLSYSLNVQEGDGIFRRHEWEETVNNSSFFVMNERYDEILRGENIMSGGKLSGSMLGTKQQSQERPSFSTLLFNPRNPENPMLGAADKERLTIERRKSVEKKEIKLDTPTVKARVESCFSDPYNNKYQIIFLSIVIIFLLLIIFVDKVRADDSLNLRIKELNCLRSECYGVKFPMCSEQTEIFIDQQVVFDVNNGLWVGYPIGHVDILGKGNDTALCSSKFFSQIKCEESCLRNGTLSCFINEENKYLIKNYEPLITKAKCRCQPAHISKKLVVYNGLKEVDVKNVTTCSFSTSFIQEPLLKSSRKLLSDESSSATVSLSNGALTITMSTMLRNAQIFFLMTKETHQKMLHLQDGFNLVSIPSEFKIKSGDLNVKIWVMDDLILDTNVFILGESICRVADCFLCSDTFSTFHCMSQTYQFIIVCLMILMVYFLLYFTWKILRCFWISLCIIKMMCKREKSTTEERESLNSNSASKLALISLLFMGKGVKACDSGIFIPVTIQDCTNNGAFQECKLKYDLTASIPFPGAETCITIGSLDDKTVLANLRIKYKTALATLTLVEQYYTKNWNLNQYSTHYCATDSPCNSVCGGVGPNDNPGDVFGDNNGDLMNHPGVSYCHSYGGCAGNGCFSCGSSCTYTRWSIQAAPHPKGCVLVMSPSSIQTTIQTVIEKQDLEGNWFTLFEGSMTAGFSVPLADGSTLTLIGSFSPPTTTIFGSNSFAKTQISVEDPAVYYGQAATVNMPQPSVLGDIQAQSCNDLLTGGQQAYIFPSNLVTCNQAKYDSCFAMAPGINSLDNPITWMRLPGKIAGDVWSFDFNQNLLWSNLANPGAILISYSTKDPVSYTRKRTVVCPKIVNEPYATGCFNCLEGFTIIFSAISTCENGSAIATVDDPKVRLSTNAIFLNPHTKEFIISGTTTMRNNEFTLTLSGSGGAVSTHVSFDAVEIISVRNTSYITGNIIQGSDKSSDWFSPFSDVFRSIGNLFGTNVWSALLTIILGVVVVIVIIKLGGLAKQEFSKKPKIES